MGVVDWIESLHLDIVAWKTGWGLMGKECGVGISNVWIQGRLQKSPGCGVKKEVRWSQWYKKSSNNLLSVVQIAVCVSFSGGVGWGGGSL